MGQPVSAILLLAAVVMAQAQFPGSRATAEQREAAIRLAASYPANPLDAALDRQATGAAARLQIAPDNPVITCSDHLPWVEAEKYPYTHELSVAYVLGTGAYTIQHPEESASRRYYPALMAGSRAAIQAYKVIVERDPEAELDDMNFWSDRMESGEFRDILLRNCEPPASAKSRSKSPATPEERQRIVALAGELQKTPLDLTLVREYQELFDLIFQSAEVSVETCMITSSRVFRTPYYKYDSDLQALNLTAMASYVLRNPDMRKNVFATRRVGLLALLRGYEAILQQEPEAKSKVLESILAEEKQGKFDDWYQKRFNANCLKK